MNTRWVVSGKRFSVDVDGADVCLVIEAPDIRTALEIVDTQRYALRQFEDINVKRVHGSNV